ncbi:malonyl-CoA decarboxylase [Chelatococcus sp. SYSU_G07232]|uniref:Malonyl-CoA decarboxylase n=1 Tax=Chelatococcus albus TaxID=3047466 RepID=A0ABT7AJW5_9HYPH|nr:malonyl-CoA decarboxylase [Chelatococcus sp. SYSU_G07232]MDJ1159114.1 malonyl-CoA decarboxylase [Chelatococcus sp. SYSU_G07232]
MPTSFFNDLLQTLTDRGRAILGLPRDVVARGNVVELGEHLLSGRGEASGVALARAVLDSYAAAPLAGRLSFLTALAERFGADRSLVEKAIEAYRKEPSEANLHALHTAAEARRQELMRRLNLAPGGTAALVRMREELLAHLSARPDLRIVDEDFVHLFSSWFNRGFLVLKPIDWTTPANILEKIIRYEAVHEIRDWDDLRGRLEPPDRRCFAFFHPQLVDEPLIFVEVALTGEIPGAIAPLLARKRTPIAAREATTAVFYSISNTQKGLAGVSFGNFLIKQVVEDLKRELPNLKTFVTLSPVPGFAAWLKRERQAEASDALDADAKATLRLLDEPGWHEDAEKAERLRKVLMAAAAWYFLKAKTPKGRPVDPVARFHLGNGARLERLDFLGDTSPKGLEQAHGLMVNYLYALEDIEKNHEAFAAAGEVIASSAVRKLLKNNAPSRAVTLIPTD